VAAAEGVTAAIDRVIELFNAKAMDLPDGFFDRRTQFVLNGSSFEMLLGRPEHDPLVLMLARGPAGFRFAAKALQHAMPDARLQRGDLTDGDPSKITTKLWLSGTLRGSGQALNTVVDVTLRLAPAGHVEVAEAQVDPVTLDQLRVARSIPGPSVR
jgi:hypothetical protein